MTTCQWAGLLTTAGLAAGLTRAGATLAAAAVTVRVRNTPGGPQIHLNGTSIPPRFLFGSMNSGSARAKPE
jgi:hypothetical protein